MNYSLGAWKDNEIDSAISLVGGGDTIWPKIQGRKPEEQIKILKRAVMEGWAPCAMKSKLKNYLIYGLIAYSLYKIVRCR